jgi:hypothetical protein
MNSTNLPLNKKQIRDNSLLKVRAALGGNIKLFQYQEKLLLEFSPNDKCKPVALFSVRETLTEAAYIPSSFYLDPISSVDLAERNERKGRTKFPSIESDTLVKEIYKAGIREWGFFTLKKAARTMKSAKAAQLSL